MSQKLQSRPVRLPGRHIQAQLEGSAVEVTNISMTGALLLAEEAPPVGETRALSLKRGSLQLQLEVQVVRVEPGDQPRWQAAVVFTRVSPELRRILPSLAA